MRASIAGLPLNEDDQTHLHSGTCILSQAFRAADGSPGLFAGLKWIKQLVVKLVGIPMPDLSAGFRTELKSGVSRE